MDISTTLLISDYCGPTLRLQFTNELMKDTEASNLHDSLKSAMLRETARNSIFLNFKSDNYRMSYVIKGFGRAVIDYTLYYYRRGHNEEFYMLIRVSNIRSRMETYTLCLNRTDIELHLGSDLRSYFFQQYLLIQSLENLASRFAIVRRNLYKKLEICPKYRNILKEGFVNEYKYPKAGEKGFLEKVSYETELVGHFSKRFGVNYAIVTVYRHTRQDMFTVKIYMPKTFKTFIMKLYFFDLGKILDKSWADLFQVNYPCLEYLSYATKDIQSLAQTLFFRDAEYLQNMSLSNEISSSAFDNLTTLIPYQRLLLIQIWERLTEKMYFSEFRTREAMVDICSFHTVIKQNLIYKFFGLNQQVYYWIEVKVGRTLFEELLLNCQRFGPRKLLDTTLHVSASLITRETASNERVTIEEILGRNDPLLERIQSHRFRIIDLYSIGKRIYEFLANGIQTNSNLRFKESLRLSQNSHPMVIKLSKDPRDRERPEPGVLFKAVNELYLFQSKRMGGTFPITLCCFVLTRRPKQVCTCLLLSQTSLVAVVQNIETLALKEKTFTIDFLEQAIPFIRHLINAKAYDVLGERVRLAVFNSVLIINSNN